MKLTLKMTNTVDGSMLRSFSGRQDDLWTELNCVQKVLNEGGLTEDAIKIQLEILDEVKEKSRDLEIQMLIALDEDELDAVEREFGLMFHRYFELKTALLAWTSRVRGLQGREKESKRVAVGNAEVVVDRTDVLGSEFSSLKNDCADDADLLALATPTVGGSEGREEQTQQIVDCVGKFQELESPKSNVRVKNEFTGNSGDDLRSISIVNENHDEAWVDVVNRFKNCVLNELNIEVEPNSKEFEDRELNEQLFKEGKFVWSVAGTWADAGGGPGGTTG